MEGVLKTLLLFGITAIAEIVGCYLPYLWLRKNGTPWLLVLAALSLSLFAWLLTLHPTASGRVYAAYGGVYVATAILWLWLIDGIQPSRWDLLGAAITLIGMAVIMFAPRSPEKVVSHLKISHPIAYTSGDPDAQATQNVADS
jgi:small multidrug resistance family-3 protein